MPTKSKSDSGDKISCSVKKFLEEREAKFLKLLEDACMDHLLSGPKSMGMTLIVPKDSVIDEISDMLNVMPKEKDAQATHKFGMVLTYRHFIKTCYPEPASFAEKKVVRNFLGEDVENPSVKGTDVKFSNGCVIVPHPNFYPAANIEGRVMVYKVSSGKMPPEGEEVSVSQEFADSRKNRGKKRGSYEDELEGGAEDTESLDFGEYFASNASSSSSTSAGLTAGSPPSRDFSGNKITTRLQLIVLIENLHAYAAQHKKLGSNNPMLAAGLHFALFLSAHRDSKVRERFITMILPRFSFSEFDIYIMLEPYKINRDYIVADKEVVQWKDSYLASNEPIDCAAAIKKLETVITTTGRYEACFKNRDGLQRELIKIRTTLGGKIFSGARNNIDKIPKAIQSAYDSFVNSNRVGAVENVYPKELCDYYRKYPGLKCIEDEARFVSICRFNEISKTNNLENFSDLTESLADYMYCICNGYTKEGCHLVNNSILKYMIDTAHLTTLKNFFYSTSSFFFTMIGGDMRGLHAKGLLTDYPPDGDLACWDSAEINRVKNSRLYIHDFDQSQNIVKALLKDTPSEEKYAALI